MIGKGLGFFFSIDKTMTCDLWPAKETCGVKTLSDKLLW